MSVVIHVVYQLGKHARTIIGTRVIYVRPLRTHVYTRTHSYFPIVQTNTNILLCMVADVVLHILFVVLRLHRQLNVVPSSDRH